MPKDHTRAFSSDASTTSNFEKNTAVVSDNDIATNAVQLVTALTKHDEARVTNCNSDIDTLLVFAGLFSVVLAAFNIEACQALQNDPIQDNTLRVLTQLSQQPTQLTSIGNSDATNNLKVEINTLWFSALICSLMVASLAMFVKQWLREYLALGCSQPDEIFRVRYVRYEGLRRWGVFETAAALPFLLQIAMFLFFLGLSEFLWPLNKTVWLVTTFLMLLWLGLYLITLCAPAIYSTCPYRTPLLTSVIHTFRWLIARACHGRKWREVMGNLPRYYRYPGDERGVRRDARLDIAALISADQVLADDGILLNAMKALIVRAHHQDVVHICKRILSHRLGKDIKSFRDSIDYERVPIRVLKTIMDSLVDVLRRHVSELQVSGIDGIVEVFAGLHSIVSHSHLRRRSVNITQGVACMLNMLLFTPHDELAEILLWTAVNSDPVPWHICEKIANSCNIEGIRSSYHYLLQHCWTERNFVEARRFVTMVTSFLNKMEPTNYNPLRVYGMIISLVTNLPHCSLHAIRGDLFEFQQVLEAKLEPGSSLSDDYSDWPGGFDEFSKRLADLSLGLNQSLDLEVIKTSFIDKLSAQICRRTTFLEISHETFEPIPLSTIIPEIISSRLPEYLTSDSNLKASSSTLPFASIPMTTTDSPFNGLSARDSDDGGRNSLERPKLALKRNDAQESIPTLSSKSSSKDPHIQINIAPPRTDTVSSFGYPDSVLERPILKRPEAYSSFGDIFSYCENTTKTPISPFSTSPLHRTIDSVIPRTKAKFSIG
ncbi:hypothetical protein C8Q75DRAFT_807307 [Abortiporus biennis]|nr:hypothetical protein C8Q75DRAFT_807307 [Abortiporus biennis]